uniref:dihydrodipicolinate synthase family protein n=1 Tax=Siphonobacter sp. TaxID=1869184 RepID=UPI003B3BA6FD
EEVAFFNGSNPLALSALAAGARGWCTAAPNLIPKLNLQLFDSFQQGQWTQAQQAFYQQFDLLQFIVQKGLPRAIQAGLELQGVSGGELRAPLAKLTSEEKAQLNAILAACF